eukprot:9761-Heterococcus_DN1.PRE.5
MHKCKISTVIQQRKVLKPPSGKNLRNRKNVSRNALRKVLRNVTCRHHLHTATAIDGDREQ